MRLAECVARMTARSVNGVWWKDLTETDYLENLDYNSIKMDLQKVGCGGMEMYRSGVGYGKVMGAGECDINKPSVSVKCEEFFE